MKIKNNIISKFNRVQVHDVPAPENKEKEREGYERGYRFKIECPLYVDLKLMAIGDADYPFGVFHRDDFLLEIVNIPKSI